MGILGIQYLQTVFEIETKMDIDLLDRIDKEFVAYTKCEIRE